MSMETQSGRIAVGVLFVVVIVLGLAWQRRSAQVASPTPADPPAGVVEGSGTGGPTPDGPAKKDGKKGGEE